MISYQTYPIAIALEAFAVIRASRLELGRIVQLCSYSSLPATIVTRAYHRFIPDIRNEHVFEDIADFLKST